MALHLTLGNENVRSRISAALAAVREAAATTPRFLMGAHRALECARVRTGESRTERKLERCAKLRKVSDLMHAEDGAAPGRDGTVGVWHVAAPTKFTAVEICLWTSWS